MTDSLHRLWFTFIQICTIPADFTVTRLLRLKIQRPVDLKLKPGTLIIANHQSRVDPFLISYHIGWRNLLHTLPIRYPVTPEYIDDKPLVGSIIKMLGGYSIGRTTLERMKRLALTRELIRSKYTVVIFPEGQIRRGDDTVEDFQRGAEMIFRENYPVVFVRLTGLNQPGRIFRQERPCRLTYSPYLDETVPVKDKIDFMVDFFELPKTAYTEST